MIDLGVYGRRFVLDGPWRAEYAALMRDQGLRELELNQAKGWQGDRIDFIEGLHDLLALVLISGKIESIGPISALTLLRSLSLDTPTKDGLDLTTFHQLEHCSLNWSGDFDSVFDSHSIADLTVIGYSGVDSGVLARMKQLKRLQILDSRLTEVESLGSLASLTALRLGGIRRLRSIAGVERALALEDLSVQGFNNLGDLSSLARLKSLVFLLLEDCGSVESLVPIAQLPNLERFYFYGNTRVADGNIKCLLGCPKLIDVRFANRRHYDIGADQMRKQLITASGEE